MELRACLGWEPWVGVSAALLPPARCLRLLSFLPLPHILFLPPISPRPQVAYDHLGNAISALNSATTSLVPATAAHTLRRLAALLPADVQLAEAVASRFRLSGAQKKRLALAAARDGAAAEARPLAYRLGIDAALDRLLIAGADTASLNGWDIPQFPLKGGEIVARGIKAGPEVARVLRQVEAGWMAAGFADSVIPALLEAELREQA